MVDTSSCSLYSPSGETRLPLRKAQIVVATSLRTGGSNMPPAYCDSIFRVSPPKEISRNGIKPFLLIWSEWRDSNSRHPGPKPGALPTGPHPDSIRTEFIIHDSLQKINQIFSEKPPELDFRGTILRKAIQIAQHIQYIITNLLRCFRRILLELSRNRCA